MSEDIYLLGIILFLAIMPILWLSLFWRLGSSGDKAAIRKIVKLVGWIIKEG